MNLFWLLIVPSVVLSNSVLLDTIGQSCDSHALFVTSSFGVSPWPVTPGVQLTLTMAGTFTKSTYVANIAVRTSYNKGKWSYKYFDIDQTYSYGQMYTFTFTITSGTGSGEYLEEVFLEIKEGDGISCWTFTYHI